MYKTYTKIDNIITNTDYSTDQKINRLSGIKIGKSTVKIGIHTASKIIKTEYFLIVQPDVIGIKKTSLLSFYKYAKILKDKFAVIGPHFKNASKRGHYHKFKI